MINPCQAIILGLTRHAALSGSEIMQAASQIPFWSVSRSQIYREINVLAVSGALSVKPVDGRANQHTSTKGGVKLLDDWLETPSSTKLVIRDEHSLRAHLAPSLGLHALGAHFHGEYARELRVTGDGDAATDAMKKIHLAIRNYLLSAE